jgi:hypothetical protein
MAKILILTHAFDVFEKRSFLVRILSEHWVSRGHEVVVHAGPDGAPAADVGILHVDATVVPREYLDALGGCRVVLNGATLDIGKRTYSENLVTAFDPWADPVIVKTDANAGGIPEWLHESIARERGTPLPGPARKRLVGRYPVFPSFAEVPLPLRLDPELVVERFLPERDPRGYASRHYLFLGDRERCTRLVGPHPVVKAADAIERTHVEVPEAIRAWRRKLGFDYGKLDFVVHEGQSVLIDANRTPTFPRGEIAAAIREGLDYLAEGIESFVR